MYKAVQCGSLNVGFVALTTLTSSNWETNGNAAFCAETVRGSSWVQNVYFFHIHVNFFLSCVFFYHSSLILLI